jgi:hypothetical protein
MRRFLAALVVILPLSAVRADALTIRDVIELSKANVGDQVLLALIEVERPVFSMDTATLKLLKESGVSEDVIVAMIRSGRTPPPTLANAEPAVNPQPLDPTPNTQPPNPEPTVIVTPAPVVVPVAVPVYYPVPSFQTPAFRHDQVITHTVVTDDGSAVRVRETLPPNCTRAEPVYWGNGGKRRAGTWEPPVQVVCR